MKIDVKFKGMEHVDEFLMEAAPEIIEVSARAAMNKTITKVRSVASKSVANSAQIQPVRLIRDRMPIFKANKKRDAAGVYFHYNPMPVETMGEPAWTKQMAGARVGRKLYPGTFAATPKAGKKAGRKRVYTRVGKGTNHKKVLHAERIMLNKFAGQLIFIGWAVTKKELMREFGGQLAFRLRKSGFIR